MTKELCYEHYLAESTFRGTAVSIRTHFPVFFIMEAIAFLAYYDARWVFQWRVQKVALGLAIAFQIGVLLWAVWSYRAGVDLWWSLLRISVCVILLCQLLGLALGDFSESLSKQLFACVSSYFTLAWAGNDSRFANFPEFTSTLSALIRTYDVVFLLVVAIVLVALFIKVCWLLLSLTKPRLHLRLHGYRDS